MTDAEIRVKVVQCVVNALWDEAGQLTDETRFADLGVDSFDLFNIVEEVENAFHAEDVCISDADMEEIRTVGELVAHVRREVGPT